MEWLLKKTRAANNMLTHTQTNIYRQTHTHKYITDKHTDTFPSAVIVVPTPFLPIE